MLWLGIWVNKDICPDYTEDWVNFKDKKVKICTYYNLDIRGLCKHEDHNTCLVYINKNGIKNNLLVNLIDTFGCTFIENGTFEKLQKERKKKKVYNYWER